MRALRVPCAPCDPCAPAGFSNTAQGFFKHDKPCSFKVQAKASYTDSLKKCFAHVI